MAGATFVRMSTDVAKEGQPMASETETGETTHDAQTRRFAIWREIGAVVILSVALCMLLALASFQATDLGGATSNLIGPVGAHVADGLLSAFGIAAFALDAALFYIGFTLLIGRLVDWNAKEIVGSVAFVISGCVVAHLGLGGYILLDHSAGGMTGDVLGESMRGLFGTVGASILSTSGFVLGLILATDLSVGGMTRGIVRLAHRAQAKLRHRLKVRREYKKKLSQQSDQLDAMSDELIERAARAELDLANEPLLEEFNLDDQLDDDVAARLEERLAELVEEKLDKRGPLPDPDDRDEGGDSAASSDSRPTDSQSQPDSDARTGEPDGDQGWEMGDGVAEEAESGPQIVVPESNVSDDEKTQDDASASTTGPMQLDADQTPATPVQGDFGPEIVESEAQKESKEKQKELENDESGMLFKPKQKGDFELPPLSYLNYESDDVGIDPDALREMAVEIEQTLEDFNIDGSVVEICPGPVITMFEFKPAPGTKISKIANREDDLLMNLAAKSVRVVAPIPGKPVVGIEVSNPEREMVWLKEVIADDSFQDNDMNLPLALGKGTAGEIETTDLSEMPHLLVAGATGSGKSVAVNSMICSLLYNFSPDELQMIMIDPKVLEFSVYNGIPHLHLPVVTDPKKATVALDWAVREMERRYERLADLGVRDIRGYNRRVKNLTEQARKDQRAGKEESAALSKLGVDAEGNPKHTPLPYLVVVIDEFADLMMTASKEVEQAVARLAQKARAAGVHMILATQRPSTDVITGMIKANFPARIALRVTSNTDSRVILGSNGAENLLGNGDMLIMPPGSSDLERIHGAFVSDEEIEQIVDFVSDQTEPEYDESILEEDDDEEESPLDREMEKDEYYEDAVRLVVQKNKASISMIQRKLRVGYNRAARMVEMMEQEGYVGPSDGNTARDVLIDSDPFAEDDAGDEDTEE